MSPHLQIPSDPRTSAVYADWARAHDPGAEPAVAALLDAVSAGLPEAYEKPGRFMTGLEWRARALPPSHLPWFWDTVGHRLLSPNPRFAGRAYGLARKAERDHGLPVDSAWHRANVLLFAGAGALPGAELTGHQAWLAAELEPSEAHQEFLRLVAAWAASGGDLPGDLARRLRASARAAGLGVAEEARVLGPLLGAARGKAVPDRLLDAAAAVFAAHPPADELGTLFLDMFPESRTDAAAWLRLLLKSGVADAVAAGRIEPEGGPAAWLGRYCWMYGHRRSGGGVARQPMPAELFDLVTRFAPRLRAAGTPVRLHEDRYRWPGLDADLLDVCLAEGIAVEDPGDVVRLTFWEERSARDLKALAADPVFGRRLEGTVHAQLRGGGSAITRLPENAGIAAEVRGRVESLLGTLRGGGLAAADEAVRELAEVLDRPTARALDGIEEALAELDLAGPLARALRAGLPEELGWPALEEAVAGFAAGEVLRVTSSWPVLTVYGAGRAVAVDHAGPRGSCEFLLPAAATAHSVHFVGGQFLVAWSTHPRHSWGEFAFWSDRPEDVFEPEEQLGLRPYGGSIHGGLGFHFESPDGGGRHDGERVLRPGGREGIGSRDLMLSDGRRFWSAPVFHAHEERTLVDPLTGEPTGDRTPPPVPCGDDVPQGTADFADCHTLAALPEGAPASPLGRDGVLVGCRVFNRTPWSGYSPREFLLESIDGRRAEYRTRTWGRRPWGILGMPAGGEDAVLVEEVTVRCHAAADNSLLWQVQGFPGSDPNRSVATLGEEAGPVPPPAFWHFLTPRDEASSRALRSVDDEAVRALLAAAVQPAAAATVPNPNPNPNPVPAPVPVPAGVTDARIAEGVARAARLAADVLRRRGELSRRVALMRAEPVVRPATPVPDTVLTPALCGLLPELRPRPHVPRPHPALLTAIAADGRHLRGEIDDEVRRLALPAQPAGWTGLVGRIDAVAWRAAVSGTPEEDRAALAALLETWSGQPFAEAGSSWRTGRAAEEALAGCRSAGATVASAAPLGGRAEFLQRAADPAPAGAEECAEHTVTRDDAARLPRLLDLVSRRGAVAVPPEAVDVLCERTGVTPQMALLALSGFPEWSDHRVHRTMLRRKPYKLTKDLVWEYDSLRGRLGLPGRLAVLAAAVPDDPADLWAPDGMTAAAERMAAAWTVALGGGTGVG